MQTQNKMATLPVGKLMLSMGIPMIISMVLQAFYNIVDSIFVSNIAEHGEEALNALTLAFPVQTLMIAISIGTGVGANALIAKSLGQKDPEKASRTVGNVVFMMAVIYAVFVLFGIFGVGPYIGSQTKNEVIYDMAVDYLRICCIVSLGIPVFSGFEKILQAEGNALYSTISQVIGAVLNIILDPIFIYGWLGLPEMGVTGAALATVIGQVASAVAGLIFHLWKDKDIQNHARFLKPSWKLIREIYAIGLPAILSQALMSVMTYGMNLILGGISETMVTAYGLYYKIQQFVLFAAFGLRDAITPIVSFSHGMGNRKRIIGGIRYGMLYTLIIMAAGLVIIEAFARPFSGVFGLSGETQELCIGAMRIISVSFLFAGANIAFQGVFQALDGGVESLVISICRQLLFLFPFALWFAQIAKQNADLRQTVWLSFPICELLSCIVAVLLYVRIYKKEISHLKAA